ncbi:tigger transposable element-derived protein 1 [Trichonephila clavipes]|uniref:Tigger transposable element-derived protein 1 n=1 Tax=Trichonephila clavipes TaxID=2585209 RepID=A0A8X6RCR9_TRICX|nr:tigger transposable element-derived protein 1 [Trichonephila clavipes]
MESGPDKIGNFIEEDVVLARQINLEMESDDVEELLDSHNQGLTVDELTEMHEQEPSIETLESVDSVKSEDQIKVGNLTEGISVTEKSLKILTNTYSNEKAFVAREHSKQRSHTQAASLLLRLVEGKERRKASDHSPLKMGWNKDKSHCHTVTYMVFKATDIDRYTPCHDEFHGSRSDKVGSDCRSKKQQNNEANLYQKWWINELFSKR